MTELPDELFDDLQARVKAGAEFLDTHQPDWREKVDPSVLEMYECKRCVLGQLFDELAMEENWGHGYSYGICRFLADTGWDEKDLGFDLPDVYCWERPYRDWDESAWQTLNDLWVKEIQR